MPQHDQPWLRQQQQRWMRPDAARFLKPGTDPAEVYPALALKYSEYQPRVPKGNPHGGEFARVGEGGSGSASAGVAQTMGSGESGDGVLSGGDATTALGFAEPMGNIDFGDFPSFDEGGPLRITVRPSYADDSGGRVQLAGEIPDGEAPFEDPAPKIPQEMPTTRAERMGFVRAAIQWVGRRTLQVGRHIVRRIPAVDTFFGLLDQATELKALTDAIKSANDPAKTLKELQRPIGTPSQDGYQDHHIVNQHEGNRKRFGSARIDKRENLARIPIQKHRDINGWYSKPNDKFDGLSPRDYLRDKDWEEQTRVGLEVLRDHGVLKR